jgi:hypothetical protein
MSEWYGPLTHVRSQAVSFTDAFIYEGHKPRWSAAPYTGWTSWNPPDGTFFVYGNAGPPKGSLVYDYAHHIAYYGEGCCSWHEVVLAAGVSAPPKRVVSRNLSSVRTVRGIALVQSVAEVMRLYGSAHVAHVTGHAELQMLSYWHRFDRSCGQGGDFVFKNDRLIYAGLMDGC